jgi:hypothetical protein
MSSKSIVAAGTCLAALLCIARLSFAQEPPQSPAAQTPKAAAPAARLSTLPAKVSLPPPKRTLPASSSAGAHTNVKTTEGLEKRAAETGKPAATMASPTSGPPR